MAYGMWLVLPHSWLHVGVFSEQSLSLLWRWSFHIRVCQVSLSWSEVKIVIAIDGFFVWWQTISRWRIKVFGLEFLIISGVVAWECRENFSLAVWEISSINKYPRLYSFSYVLASSFLLSFTKSTMEYQNLLHFSKFQVSTECINY